MATGASDYFDLQSDLYGMTLRVHWSETFDASTNRSTVSITKLQLKCSEWYGLGYALDGPIYINGIEAFRMSSLSGSNLVTIGYSASDMNQFHDVGGTFGSVSGISHKDDGSGIATISVSVHGYRYGGGTTANGWSVSGSKDITLKTIPTYTLSISAGTGSSITVNRISSGYARTGNIDAGTRLYYGDKLKITFSPSTNYRLLTTKVNNSDFTSGNTHTVTANVSVTSTAQVLASAVGATDANIGSTSTITVTKYNTAYYHSLQYSFGSLSGYITSSGGVQSSETKFSGTSVAFSVPATFYAQIPNAKTGTCTITCRTYSSSSSTTVLGNATTCTFTVASVSDNCAPTLSASVVDTNSITTALTGDPSKLIKYMSTAQCTINATRRQSATIKTVKIADATVTGTTSGDVTTATKSFTSTDKTSFKFSATDSRGYTTTKTVSPTVVAYVKLTCNPEITRPTPTGSTIVITFSGNMYRGSFGAYSNTLTLQYRYKVNGGSYGLWQTIDQTNIVFGTSNYRSSSAITLGDDFDYKKSYEFQVKATDGTSDYVLSTVTVTIPVSRGLPVFDWGENDFNFNVPVKVPTPTEDSDAVPLSYLNSALGNVKITMDTLRDLIFPVNSIYISYSHTSPASLFGGTWTRIENRFLLAANSSGKIGSTGGESNHILTVNEIPLHKHDVNVYYDYPASTTVPATYGMISGANLNWSASERSGKHYAGYGFTSTEGGGKSHNNLPPYIQVSVWRRTA